MQLVLVLLAVVSSTAWVAVDASKRDWSDNGFAKNVQSWVVGSLLLWPVLPLLYVFVHRKKAPLLAAAAPKPVPAVAMEAAGPAEQYGPSLDDVERVAEVNELPVAEVAPAPVVEVEPEPVVEIEPEPEPIVEIEPEPVVEVEPEPVVEVEPEPVVEIEPEPEPVTVGAPAAEDAPPGLSVDAFKDIKPVSFGGFAGDDDEAEPEPEPEPTPVEAFEPLTYALDTEPVIEVEPEPFMDPAPFSEPEPIVAAAPVEPMATAEPARKRGLRLPGPQLKLPQLPASLEGPLTELERKIVLGSVVAVVAAAALGYTGAS